MNLVTRFGYVQIVDLDFFVKNLQVRPLIYGDFSYLQRISHGTIVHRTTDGLETLKNDSFVKIEPTVRKFEVIGDIEQGITEDIKSNVKMKGKAKSVEQILLDYVDRFGEPTHLVMMPNNLIMPVNFNDFHVKIFSNEFAFCCIEPDRFFSYQHDLDRHLKEIRA
jgi:hypothetical protein